MGSGTTLATLLLSPAQVGLNPPCGRHRELALDASMESDPANQRGAWALAGPNDQEAVALFQLIGREQW